MKPILTSIAVALACALPAAAHAARLDALAAAVAVPANATYEGPDWTATNTVPAIRWSHTGLREVPAAPSSRAGATKVDGLGNASVMYYGVRAMVESLTVTFGGGRSQPVDPADFDKVVKAQFAGSQIKKLRGMCKDEGGVSGSAVYQIAMPAKKPVYLFAMTDSGGSAPDSQSTMFEFTRDQEERWKCTP